MITLDGSTLEGGGQLVRVALSLSAMRGIPVRIERVRANRAPRASKRTRPSGGLKESHLAALHWLADACGAKTSGDMIGSEEFTFRSAPRNGQLTGPATSTIELKRPGSVWLVLQALLPFIIFSMNTPHFELVIRGGTNVSNSMSGEYVQQVLIPTLERIGLPKIQITIPKRGWANAASEIGEVRICIDRLSTSSPTSQQESAATSQPYKLRPFQMTNRGTITKLHLSILAHDQPTRTLLFANITQALANTPADLHLTTLTPELTLSEASGDPRRTYVLLVAHTSNGWRLGRDVLMERKPKNAKEMHMLAEKIARELVAQMVEEVRRGGCVDEYAQDQLVVWQALAAGSSIVDGGVSNKSPAERPDGQAGDHDGEGTLHTRTVRWVCEQLLGDGVAFGAGGWCKGVGQNASLEDQQKLNEEDLGELIEGITNVALDHR